MTTVEAIKDMMAVWDAIMTDAKQTFPNMTGEELQAIVSKYFRIQFNIPQNGTGREEWKSWASNVTAF